MSFGRGGRGRGGRGGRGGFGRDRQNFDEPPAVVQEFGVFTHPCQANLVIKANSQGVPYFNAPIYLENKQMIGKVDEIFGPIKDYVSYKLVLVSAIYLLISINFLYL